MEMEYQEGEDFAQLAEWTITMTTFPNVVSKRIACQITDWSVNSEIDLAEFRIDFPKNTVVYDGRNKQRFVAKGGNIKRGITDAEIKAGASYKRLTNTKSGDAVPAPAPK